MKSIKLDKLCSEQFLIIYQLALDIGTTFNATASSHVGFTASGQQPISNIQGGSRRRSIAPFQNRFFSRVTIFSSSSTPPPTPFRIATPPWSLLFSGFSKMYLSSDYRKLRRILRFLFFLQSVLLEYDNLKQLCNHSVYYEFIQFRFLLHLM